MGYERRVGRFRVTREMIDDNLGPLIYREVVPIEVRLDYMTGNFDVLAMSEYFDEVPQYQSAPLYIVSFDNKSVRFELADELVPERGFGPAEKEAYKLRQARALQKIASKLSPVFSREQLDALIREVAPDILDEGE